jgi:hypothetical protein
LKNLTLPLLRAALESGGRPYEFTAPRLTQGAGAALYAAKLAGTPLKPDAVAQLACTHTAFAGAGT